jgi:putative YphP/YqiW family bacilliredoxin
MPYDEMMVKPMREELTRLGVQELRTAADVDRVLASKSGTVMIVVNSVCGCAAGGARPGIALALKHPTKPDTIATVFAGQDVEAVARARSFFGGNPPSSPAIALFKDGKLAQLIQRWEIEGRSPDQISKDLMASFDKHCAKQPAKS